MTPVKTINYKDWYSLQLKVQEKKVAEAFELLESHKIQPILIKGWAVARLYPSKNPRPFTDIDLCVDPKVYPKTLDIIKTDRAKRLNIDLHCGLRHLDTVEWEDLFEHAKLVEIDHQKIRILCPEDHLRVLAVHWLIDRGQNKDRLWDIFYTFSNTPESFGNFDWERCLNVVGENRRRWIICTIGLAQKYLQISLRGTPFENEVINVPEWLCRAVEREWKRGYSLKPLQTCLSDPMELLKQLHLRIPPNPVQATVEMEGSFDKSIRIQYQIGNMFARIIPSIERITEVLNRKSNEKKDKSGN